MPRGVDTENEDLLTKPSYVTTKYKQAEWIEPEVEWTYGQSAAQAPKYTPPPPVQRYTAPAQQRSYQQPVINYQMPNITRPIQAAQTPQVPQGPELSEGTSSYWKSVYGAQKRATTPATSYPAWATPVAPIQFNGAEWYQQQQVIGQRAQAALASNLNWQPGRNAPTQPVANVYPTPTVTNTGGGPVVPNAQQGYSMYNNWQIGSPSSGQAQTRTLAEYYKPNTYTLPPKSGAARSGRYANEDWEEAYAAQNAAQIQAKVNQARRVAMWAPSRIYAGRKVPINTQRLLEAEATLYGSLPRVTQHLAAPPVAGGGGGNLNAGGYGGSEYGGYGGGGGGGGGYESENRWWLNASIWRI